MRNLTRTTALASGLLLATGAMAQTTDLGAHGFSISLGDEVIAGATPPYREGLAPADAALQRLDMQVQFDTLRQERMLNVLTEDMREAYAAGEEVRFRASMNYPAFVDRAEVLILDRTRPGRRVVDVVPVAPNGTGGWVMPAGGPADLAYVLRVYDARGRFDETHPVILRRTADPSDAPALNAAYRQPGEGEDRTARRNIPVRGGTVIVSGQNAVPGDTITVAGDEVMVDGSGRFVVTRILPVGDNIVEVEAYGRRILRDVHVPQSDWFRTGLIDITAGYADGELYGDREHYLDGRAAFYVSGITASGWRVTASADTEYGPLEDMFSRLDDRDTLRVLDRLREDGNDLYPTYGDDSTWYDDTPTSGNLYLRVQNETTRLTWGDFTSSVEGAGLMRSSRDLYGVELRHRSAGTTVDGNPRLQASVYAATPDSLPQRDILRGTGGSLYFLSRRELVGGSTRVTIEETDPDTGFVVATRTLAEGADYQVDHLQGVLILNEPLASGTSDGTVISGPAAERVLNLVVQYEYLPAGDVGEASFGGRVEGWVNDDIRLGATGLSDETGRGPSDQYRRGHPAGIRRGVLPDGGGRAIRRPRVRALDLHRWGPEPREHRPRCRDHGDGLRGTHRARFRRFGSRHGRPARGLRPGPRGRVRDDHRGHAERPAALRPVARCQRHRTPEIRRGSGAFQRGWRRGVHRGRDPLRLCHRRDVDCHRRSGDARPGRPGGCRAHGHAHRRGAAPDLHGERGPDGLRLRAGHARCLGRARPQRPGGAGRGCGHRRPAAGDGGGVRRLRRTGGGGARNLAADGKQRDLPRLFARPHAGLVERSFLRQGPDRGGRVLPLLRHGHDLRGVGL
jgi:hypothetical protein